MDAEDRFFLKRARALTDEERFNIFLDELPREKMENIPRALRLLSHCSWSPHFQRLLFEYYAPKTHGEQMGYMINSFLKVMSLKKLMILVWNLTDNNERDRYFCHYYITRFVMPNFDGDDTSFESWKTWDEATHLTKIDRA